MVLQRHQIVKLQYRVLALVDEGVLIPGKIEFASGESDRFVVESLNRLVRHCHVLPFTGVRPLLNAIDSLKPDVVFNLTQHANNDRLKDTHVCAVLELEGVPYTGASLKGLMLGRDKAVSKQIAERSGFRVPRFFVANRRQVRIPNNVTFPVVVKPRYGDASEGISQAALVNSTRALVSRIRWLLCRGFEDVICEEFIEGREMAVGVLGNEIVGPRELLVGRKGLGSPRLASDRFKYNSDYRRHWKVKTRPATLTASLLRELKRCTLKTAAALEMRDYGRLDIKLTPKNEWTFLEANPNPALSKAGTTWSKTWDSVDYDAMIRRITQQAHKRRR
jgi:D-alanine-D-alanine ligase